jgi:hypothetical protein
MEHSFQRDPIPTRRQVLASWQPLLRGIMAIIFRQGIHPQVLNCSAGPRSIHPDDCYVALYKQHALSYSVKGATEPR